MAGQMLLSLRTGGKNMDDAERKAMRDQIVWLTQELERARRANQDKTLLFARLLSPDDLGHAVSNEVRQLIYTTLINEQDAERESWNKK